MCNQHSELNIDMHYPETGGIHDNMESKTSKGLGWKALIDKEDKRASCKKTNNETYPFPLWEYLFVHVIGLQAQTQNWTENRSIIVSK